jgi:hypothetical protein
MAANEPVKLTYRIEGGVPDGMFERLSESGECAKSVRIKTSTRHGNNNTSARGIEKEESLVSRTRRLKKPMRGEAFSAHRGTSSVFSGLSFEVGSLLVMSWRSDMAVLWRA